MIERRYTYILKSFIIVCGIAFLITSCTSTESNQVKRDLSQNWLFKMSGSEEAPLQANVPGTVHTDLLTHKKINDPYYQYTEDSIYWIERKDWEYTRVLNISEEDIKHQHVDLAFEGLDTYADVFVNNQKILEADNMHRAYKIDIKKYVQSGENQLKVVFKSPSIIGEEKIKNYPYLLPTISEKAPIGKETAPYTRKASFHYGWDWAPRLATMGIWRPVYLETWDEANFRNLHFTLNDLNPQKAALTAKFEIESEVDGKATVSISDQNSGEKLVEKEVTLQKGTHEYAVSFDVNQPKLWWTNGLGEPHLYAFQGTFSMNQKSTQKTVDYGIRTLKLVREKDDYGTSFKFQLNGKDVFIKGANWVPGDVFIPSVTEEKYKWLIDSAKDANMNLLRVWGGAIYENDAFYKFCNENGILIWQDFMFACMHYPGTEEFLENVKQEAIQNIKRLRNHPSIAMWCGNNEIEEGWKPWQWSKKYQYSKEDSTQIYKDYEKLFYKLLPDAVKEYDPSRDYWASSPSAKPGEEGVRYIQNHTSGDMHFWGVWFGYIPFESFYDNSGRFMSEYGFQSFPEMKTLRTFATEKDMEYNSPLMTFRQRSFPQNHRMQEIMNYYYKRPKNFESFVYLSQLNQAEGIKKAIGFHRLSKPRTMGTIYWQLNDVWPTMSWSSVDYYGNWKALQYFTKKINQDVVVIPKQHKGQLEVYVVSDRLEKTNLTFEYVVKTLEGKELFSDRVELVLKENESRKILKAEKVSEFLSSRNVTEKAQNIVIEYFLKEENKIVFKEHHFLLPIKELHLENPELTMSWKKENGIYSVELSSKKFAKNVALTSNRFNGKFSDNYFDMLPNETKTIQFFPLEKEQRDYQPEFSVQSVWETYNEKK